jgi:serine O-acetyltransferase
VTATRSAGDDLGLLELVREDWRAHSPRPLAKPGFHALALHRFGYWQQRLHPSLRLPARIVHDGLYYITRVVYGIELPRTTRVGHRVIIGHQGGIVISGEATIGDDCVIRQNVTVGATEEAGPVPTIGNRVDIGAGAVIVGGVTVGDDVGIGPNAVVVTDVPAGSRVVAPPSQILTFGSAVAPAAVRRSPAVSLPDGSDVAGLVSSTLDVGMSVDADTPLISTGLVDSLNVVVLLEALEAEYGVAVPSEEIDAENFDTPSDIAAFLRARG